MRAVQRTVARAGLPVHYSQGYNPRPVLSLTCPRPVGVASEDDLLVLSLDETSDGEVDPESMVSQLNEAAPCGLRFDRPRPLPGKRAPQPVRVRYELPLPPGRVEPVRDRLAELHTGGDWTVTRGSTDKGKGRSKPPREIDLRPLVASAAVEDGRLTFTLVPRRQRWAKPAELLALLGLDPRGDLADVIRREVDYDAPDA